METSGRSRTSYSTVLIFLGLLVAELLILPMRVRGNAEFSADGLGCDSCGKDCSAMCGSRQFRSCCFNYIKKRSSGPPSNIHNNNNPNNIANSPSNPGAELLDPSSSSSPSSSPFASSRFSQRKNGGGGSKIEESQNGNRVDGGSTDDQQEEQDQQQQQMFSVSFPGGGGGGSGIISSTSPINSLKIPGSNWNSHVFLVTETEIPDHLIRRYLSPSSSPGSGFSFPRNNRGSGSAGGRLMRNRLHSTSAASAQSSNFNPNWISITNPNEIDK